MSFKPRIYVETSVISYLASRPSRDVLTLARQEISHDFWLWALESAQLFASELTLAEISRGDAGAAKNRLDFFDRCKALDSNEASQQLALQLMSEGAVPSSEPDDAAHIAQATLTKMDYIASWNFSHIVGPQAKRKLQRALEQLGYAAPLLATPEEIFEELLK